MDLTDAYDNVGHVADAAAYPDRWAEAARAFRMAENSVGRARLNLPYGEAERQALDLFYPAGRPAGLVVFVHGGYWRRFGRQDFSHMAAGCTVAGWAVAVPSYTLAPEARIGEITAEVAAAVTRAADLIPGGPMMLAGHSAGGHLVARMAMPDVALPTGVRGRIRRILPVSPVGDLRPLLQTDMNADLRLDPDEAAAESPTLGKPAPDMTGAIWVGAAELPAFVEQAVDLGAAWGWPVRQAEGRHHFDVVEALEDPNSAMVRDLLTA